MVLEAQSKAFCTQLLRYKRMVAGTTYDKQLIVRQEREKQSKRQAADNVPNGSFEYDEYRAEKEGSSAVPQQTDEEKS